MVQVPLVYWGGTDSFLWYPNSRCSGTGQDVYVCGWILSLTYWALAFDQCKLDYLDCLPNQDIIQFNGGYQNSAWRLANSAYAYALKNMPSTGNVDVFHSLVAARYNEFRAAGYISMADYLRVSALLSSHCLGPSNLCLAGYHKLPNSSLPSFVTEKHPNFVEAESGFAFGTATKPYGSASGGQYVSFGADGDLYIPVNIATPGTYRVHLVATHVRSVSIQVLHVASVSPALVVGFSTWRRRRQSATASAPASRW